MQGYGINCAAAEYFAQSADNQYDKGISRACGNSVHQCFAHAVLDRKAFAVERNQRIHCQKRQKDTRTVGFVRGKMFKKHKTWDIDQHTQNRINRHTVTAFETAQQETCKQLNHQQLQSGYRRQNNRGF